MQVLPYLDFIHDVESILIASIREDNLHKGIRCSVRSNVSFERVFKVGVRVLDSGVAAQHDQAGDGDEDESEELDDSDAIREPVRVFRVES